MDVVAVCRMTPSMVPTIHAPSPAKQKEGELRINKKACPWRSTAARRRPRSEEGSFQSGGSLSEVQSWKGDDGSASNVFFETLEKFRPLSIMESCIYGFGSLDLGFSIQGLRGSGVTDEVSRFRGLVLGTDFIAGRGQVF